MAKKSKRKIIVKLFGIILLFLSILAYFSAAWLRDKYGEIGFDAVLFTLFSDLNGVSQDLIFNYIENALIPTLIVAFIAVVILFFEPRKTIVIKFFGRKGGIPRYPFRNVMCFVLTLLLSGAFLRAAALEVNFIEYVKNNLSASKIFETRYVDPKDTNIVFPEKKRNLIYIYMESMETTFLSQELSGGLTYNTIPELYELALNNINFSDNGGVGGGLEMKGATWTMGALVAHTAGIPLKLPDGINVNTYGEYEEFLPGVTSMVDVLHENGYWQSFMCGSDASFGGRKKYFEQHGIDKIYDYYSAARDGIIPEGYYEWWGMADYYLYEYAKTELPKIAESDQPFAFTMLTVDTHHIGGLKCPYCENVYAEKYENVYACASRQVAEFVNWLSGQDFYENTTVIITGDHNSMDQGYISRAIGEDYTRHIYNCFINAPLTASNSKNRIFTQFDMFPTTLAAIGCEIDGERLGLGVNLFSDVSTLAEEYGFEEFEAEVSKKSRMYDNTFLMPISEIY